MLDATNGSVVLVVDDDPFVLNTLSGVLAHFGFKVRSAASPAEALRAAAARERIDLLLCDVVMPELNGPALAQRILQLHRETQCLFMAGFPDHPDVVNSIVGRGLPFLPKPFLPNVLVAKVREVLNRGSLTCAATA